MITYHIDNWFTKQVVEMDRYNQLSDDDHLRLYSEIKNATLQGLEKKFQQVWDDFDPNNKIENKVQSLLLWVLGYTDDKPTSNIEIKSMGSYADIDTDVSQARRGEVYDYIVAKYGSNKASHVSTFGTLKAKAAIRAAQRALGFNIEHSTHLCKYIENRPDVTLIECFENNDYLKELLVKINPTELETEYINLLNTASSLESLPNNIGMHASAVALSGSDMTDTLGLTVASRKESSEIMTQFEYYDVEALGVIKLDLLGLKTLDIISDTIKLVEANKKIKIIEDEIDINDSNIYKLLLQGHVDSIFQLDGAAATWIPKIQPMNINEISDLTSIIRPGPAQSGLPEEYIKAKFTGDKYRYGIEDEKLLEKVWGVCKDSYGLIVYQEQVILCFSEISGFNEIESDNGRRIISKKKPEEMVKLREQFLEGALKNGYNEKCLNALFDTIANFAAYCFNKSHAVSYSYITCITAWLSYYYPIEFFTTLLTIDSDNTDKIISHIKAIKKRGLSINSPDINKSSLGFTFSEKEITFGLKAIKGVGETVSKKIIKNRPKKGYTSFGHFIDRNLEHINSKLLEGYIKAGCFSSLGYNKQTLLNIIPELLDFISIQKSIQTKYTIFNLIDISFDKYIESCIIRYCPVKDDVAYEIQSLGVYITQHPMDSYIVNSDKVKDLSTFNNYEDGQIFATIGAISGLEIKKTKAKANMAVFGLDTSSASISCICFPKAYAEVMNYLEQGKVIYVAGRVKRDDMDTVLMVNTVKENFESYADKIIERDNIEFVSIDSITDFNVNHLYINVNNKLKVTLQRT